MNRRVKMLRQSKNSVDFKYLPVILTIGLCSILSGCNEVGEHISPGTLTGPAVEYRLYGIDFSPYMDGQDPNSGVQISEKQLTERMTVIAPYTERIRTYSCTGGLEKSCSIASEKGLKVTLGVWLSRDLDANESEISSLIDIATKSPPEMIVVGSEVLLRNDLTSDELIDYIIQVKHEFPGIPVATSDVYSEILVHPDIIDRCDAVLVNYYPYWEGVEIDRAIASLHAWHQQVVAMAGDKPVIVSETGWPSCGDKIGEALPSYENASFYFLNFVSWARVNDVPYFYFEAFDEIWKAAFEGPQGACWGVWDIDGRLKSGMQDVFDGKMVKDNWSSDPEDEDDGNPGIEFTYVPPYGSFDNLKGLVTDAAPGDFEVAVYIYVSGWWTKPYWSSPLTSIRSDGSWICDITTGGIDQKATKIAAYLLPAGYNPPLMYGNVSLPTELDSNAVAKVEVKRTP
jgi:exo-beta-1,3-glucanase (GH17 family)